MAKGITEPRQRRAHPATPEMAGLLQSATLLWAPKGETLSRVTGMLTVPTAFLLSTALSLCKPLTKGSTTNVRRTNILPKESFEVHKNK